MLITESINTRKSTGMIRYCCIRASGAIMKNTSSDTNRTLNLYLANFSQSDIT